MTPKKARFQAELVLGHNDVTALLVPFDPREVWHAEPVPLDERREGWLVHGSLNGAPLDGWIGLRWGRFFLIVSPEMREAAGTAVGETIDVVVQPTRSRKALAIAREQAKLTTAPGRGKRRAGRVSRTGR